LFSTSPGISGFLNSIPPCRDMAASLRNTATK
jgi:hypothetical protein